MSDTSMDLAWIVVHDFKKALKFYTDVVGLTIKEKNEEWGWAELEGKSGARIGIAKRSDTMNSVTPGQNAVLTFTVKDLEKSTKEMTSKGAARVGEVQEVPGQVRMQLLRDTDGNHFQLVQMLSTTHKSK